MTELTDKEKAALLQQWAAETEIELLEREYSKPWSVKLSVRAGKRGFRAGMEWAESNRSFKQVECMAKSYGLILQPEDEALFDDDDNAELSVSTWDKEGRCHLWLGMARGCRSGLQQVDREITPQERLKILYERVRDFRINEDQVLSVCGARKRPAPRLTQSCK